MMVGPGVGVPRPSVPPASGGGAPAWADTNSLSFVASSAQYLSATGKVTINQQKFTFACWFKKQANGVAQALYYMGDGTINNRFVVNFTSADVINVQAVMSAASAFRLTTTATYTDGAWHHLLVAVDTTQAIAANRVLVYVDGVLLTAFSIDTLPTQNAAISNNYADTYFLGANLTALTPFTGELAQVYYIDGQALTPASFITGTPGSPMAYPGTYTGTFDFFLPFTNGASTTTLGADGSGEGNNWTLNAMTTANQSTDHP